MSAIDRADARLTGRGVERARRAARSGRTPRSRASRTTGGARTPRPGRVYVGTSGWSYNAWKHDFYAGVPRARWLEHYAASFAAVEVNATFYRALPAETLARWHDATPAAFRFALKAHRSFTHVHRLAVPATSLARQNEAFAALRDKLAVVLWQLPAHLHRDFARLRAFAEAVGTGSRVRQAIEFRHPSWFDDRTLAILKTHRIANVLSDAADWPLWPALTTDFVYLRLHGAQTTYRSGYASRSLADWGRRIGMWRDDGRAVYAFFDNTDAGHAHRNARTLLASLASR